MTLRGYLLDLREKQGYLTPQIVLDDARPKDSALHDRFTWDDAEAAEAHRLDQARDLIRSVRVQYIENDGRISSTRAFVNIDRPPAQREFVPIEEVRDDPELTAIALRTAEREWRSLFSRYSHMKEFLELVRKDIAA